MRALLLLGLSRILQKKAQLLVADCLRIQSAIGDVMSITTNDLPKDVMIANDQQITLSSAPGTHSLLDVDISMDQGDVVDKWIEAVCFWMWFSWIELRGGSASQRFDEWQSELIRQQGHFQNGQRHGHAPAVHTG